MSHHIEKDNMVSYFLKSKEAGIEEPLNQYLGKKIKIQYLDQINCIACGRKTNKSFNQGYCYPCMQKLAECDICIVKPELCHYDAGTCREPDFGEEHCNITHTLYISLTSSMKIGVTRQYQETSRWVDQGAVAALRLVSLRRRHHAGLLEVEIAKNMPDKTNWRRMLKNEVDQVDLLEQKKLLLERIKSLVTDSPLAENLNYVLEDAEILGDNLSAVQSINYPVLEYPNKLVSFNLDKDPLVEGTLLGIKGQYLLLDTGVINLRKYAGYLLEISLG